MDSGVDVTWLNSVMGSFLFFYNGKKREKKKKTRVVSETRTSEKRLSLSSRLQMTTDFFCFSSTYESRDFFLSGGTLWHAVQKSGLTMWRHFKSLSLFLSFVSTLDKIWEEEGGRHKMRLHQSSLQRRKRLCSFMWGLLQPYLISSSSALAKQATRQREFYASRSLWTPFLIFWVREDFFTVTVPLIKLRWQEKCREQRKLRLLLRIRILSFVKKPSKKGILGTWNE